jgi:TDG/mug DNA glycosylase family protein
VTYPFETLPDLLGPGLELVLVGINPSTYAVAQGHYFARRTNRFWPAFSRSRLSARARAALGVETLGPVHDVELPAFGIGFTDVVKIPSPMATSLTAEDFRTWTPRLVKRLREVDARFACFHGLTAFRPFVRWGLGRDPRDCALGPQPFELGRTRLFVVPNPSPANAHFTPDDQAGWYDRLADFMQEASEQA